MCGIAGAFGPGVPSPERIDAVYAALRHRGPDARGSYRGRGVDGAPLALLHTRLSIIDLDPRADQPFRDDGVALVFNGEIYNYLEIRAELEDLGRSFRTRSDTEVILQAYRQWGRSCVDRFQGMWAFALWDEREGGLWLSRDPFGEKPLYWTLDGGTFYFASEIKALAALSGRRFSPNLARVRRYLVNGFRSLGKRPDTWFDGVAALPPASGAWLAEPGRPEAEIYWRLRHAPRDLSWEEAKAGARERLFRALEIRLRADVPLAFCLSGGVDSTVLASVAAKRFGQPIAAFSIIDFDPRYDERVNIQAVVDDLGCEHHAIHTSREGFLDRLATQIAAHDAPVISMAFYVHNFLSQEIGRHGYKAAMTGMGADELFTGYYDHYNFWLAEMRGGPGFPGFLEAWRQGFGRYVRNPILQNPLHFADHPGDRSHLYLNRELFNGFMTEPVPEERFEGAYAESLLRNRMLNELTHENVPVYLHSDDLNSMMYSVENRSPFLDRPLAEFLFSVPTQHLVREGRMKALLREAGKGFLVDQVRLEKRKQGFNVPIGSLLDFEHGETLERVLAPGPIYDLVRREAVEAFLQKGGGDFSTNSFSKFLFGFISARLFLDRFS